MNDRQIIIDERMASAFEVPAGTDVLIFKGTGADRVNDKDLMKAFASQTGVPDIKTIVLDYTSSIKSARILTGFPNVERLVIANGFKIENLVDLGSMPRLRELVVQNRKSPMGGIFEIVPRLSLRHLGVEIVSPKDAGWINQCRHLESLTISKWKDRDLSALADLRLMHIRILFGSLAVLSGLNSDRLVSVACAGCRRLRRIESMNLPLATFDACANLEFEDLTNLCNLRALEVLACKSFGSLDFIRRCKALLSLTVTGNASRAKDLSPLIESEILRDVWLSPMPSESIKELASKNQRLLVTNSRVYYSAGQQIDVFGYERLLKDLAISSRLLKLGQSRSGVIDSD